MQRAERAYAADGYARLNGMAALTVTNAVGALSAINGVAGSYAEHVPVVCVCGSIPLRAMDRGLGMHHTMADGTWDRFIDAYAQVTVAQARLTPHNAVTEIDRLILTAWREKLPVYMELPSDIAYLESRSRRPRWRSPSRRAIPSGCGRAPPRSRAGCRGPSRRRSWWT